MEIWLQIKPTGIQTTIAGIHITPAGIENIAMSVENVPSGIHIISAGSIHMAPMSIEIRSVSVQNIPAGCSYTHHLNGYRDCISGCTYRLYSGKNSHFWLQIAK